jgi:transcriptional regulator with XRE-family HTH domain
MAAFQASGTEHVQDWPAPPDPGDLSRRLVQRRTELRLSVAQVAERARMSVRYLEYLERFPARPSPGTLRHLAAALRTTPAALLGAGGDLPAGHGLPAAQRIEQLSQTECRRLIAPGGIGRIGLVTSSGPLILPVNFAVVAATIVLRTSAGSTLAAHAFESVAFEVDHIDEALGQGWSVLVRGEAHPVLQLEERRNLTARTDLRPWPLGDHELYIRIVPSRITGRRLLAQ